MTHDTIDLDPVTTQPRVSISADALKAAGAQPLFLGDPQAMLAKLETSTGTLGQLWRAYQQRMHSNEADDAEQIDKEIHLQAALTGRGIERAKAYLQRRWQQLAENDLDFAVQKHTWCTSGANMRLAVYADWLHAKQPFSQDELEACAQSHLGFALKHAYPTLLSRVVSCDNQNLAMTLYCAAVGYLFGHKLTQHATGRFLFAYGVNRLPRLLGLFPHDGYAGEGSTYTSHVNTPLVCWCHQFFATLGMAQAHQPMQPNDVTCKNSSRSRRSSSALRA